MEILTDEAKKEREEWLKKRIRLATMQNVIQCKYCGAHSGIYKITLRKFYLKKSKMKIYLCQRHYDKSTEVDELISFMNSKEYEDLKTTMEKKRKSKALKKKIIIISILSLIVILSIIFIFI